MVCTKVNLCFFIFCIFYLKICCKFYNILFITIQWKHMKLTSFIFVNLKYFNLYIIRAVLNFDCFFFLFIPTGTNLESSNSVAEFRLSLKNVLSNSWTIFHGLWTCFLVFLLRLFPGSSIQFPFHKVSCLVQTRSRRDDRFSPSPVDSSKKYNKSDKMVSWKTLL